MATTERDAVEYALEVRARLLEKLGRPEEAEAVRQRVANEDLDLPASEVTTTSRPQPETARITVAEKQARPLSA